MCQLSSIAVRPCPQDTDIDFPGTLEKMHNNQTPTNREEKIIKNKGKKTLFFSMMDSSFQLPWLP